MWFTNPGWRNYPNHAALDGVAAPYAGGPGDVVGGAIAWYGLRGYSIASSTGSNPAVRLVDQGGLHPIDINILSNGNLDVASISAWVTTWTVTTIKITTLYDQSGNFRHATQGNLANMPTLTLSVLGSLPAAQPAGGQFLTTGTIATAFSQPNTVSAVVNRTGATGSAGAWFGGSSAGASFEFLTANTVQMYDGSPITASASDGATHAIQMVSNNTGSTIYIDGSNNPNTSGTFSIGSGSTFFLMTDGFANNMTGNWFETGVWNSDIGASKSAMNSNQHGYWVF